MNNEALKWTGVVANEVLLNSYDNPKFLELVPTNIHSQVGFLLEMEKVRYSKALVKEFATLTQKFDSETVIEIPTKLNIQRRVEVFRKLIKEGMFPLKIACQYFQVDSKYDPKSRCLPTIMQLPILLLNRGVHILEDKIDVRFHILYVNSCIPLYSETSFINLFLSLCKNPNWLNKVTGSQPNNYVSASAVDLPLPNKSRFRPSQDLDQIKNTMANMSELERHRELNNIKSYLFSVD